MKIIVGALVLLLLSGCGYLSDKHYDNVKNLDSEFEQLKEKDQQLEQEIEDIKAALRQKNAAAKEGEK